MSYTSFIATKHRKLIMKIETKRINQMDLEAGMIVHAHGARFEVISVTLRKERDPRYEPEYKSSQAKWLDGATVPGYFGPGCGLWNFQGNKNVTQTIEA